MKIFNTGFTSKKTTLWFKRRKAVFPDPDITSMAVDTTKLHKSPPEAIIWKICLHVKEWETNKKAFAKQYKIANTV